MIELKFCFTVSKMEPWFKADVQLPGIDYEQMGSPDCEQTDLPESLSMSNDFSHCLDDKLPLELLTAEGEVASVNIELEVQLDDKSFSSSNEVPTCLVLSSEETILFEEVRDTPVILHDEREGLVAVQSNIVDIKEEKIMLLTPHELESMKVADCPLESDSEKESIGQIVLKNQLAVQNLNSNLPNEKMLTPVAVSQGNEVVFMCPIQECSKSFPKLCMAKSHIITHIGVRQYKVKLA